MKGTAVKKLVSLIAAGLMVAALATPASAGKAKKVSLFLHGNYPVGDYTEFVSNTGEGTTMVMDENEPDSPLVKSFGVFQPYNELCTGNPLFASWEGKLTGTIVGPIKLTAHFVAPPTTVRVRLWADIPFASCTSSAAGVDNYVEPLYDEEVDVPPGANAVDVVFKSKKLKVKGNLIVEISQASGASQGRVLYDSTQTPSALQFTCSC